MLPFIRRALTAKVGSQSSEHGVVATGRHDHLSSCCVERHIELLRSPYAMQQNGQLTCDRNDRLVPGLLATSRSQMWSPPVEATSLCHEV